MRGTFVICAVGLLALTGLSGNAQQRELREMELEGQTERHKAAHEEAVDLRLVGFTEKRTPGTIGVFQLHAICKEDFGTRSRMCTLSELQRTVSIPDLAMDTAWVNTEKYAPADVVDRLSDCGGWSDPGGAGAVVDDLGRFFFVSSCSEAHAIACCAPGG